MDYRKTKLGFMINRVESYPTGYDYPITSTFTTESSEVNFRHSEMLEVIGEFEKVGNEFSANKLRTEYQAIININN